MHAGHAGVGQGLGRWCISDGALIAREDLDVASDRALGHYTHEKSSVGCAAALATLNVIQDEGLLERSRVLGAHGLRRLRAMRAEHAAIRTVRGLGVSFGVEVADAALAEAVMYRCLAEGLNFKVGGGDVLTLCPPLTITQGELDAAIDIVDAAMQSLPVTARSAATKQSPSA